jgi:hypothetical protein
LRDGGEPAKADAVLQAKREHQLSANNTPLLTKFGLWWLKWFIGYGYKPFQALWWFLGLVVIGLLVAVASFDLGKRGWFERFWYSFDKALPLIRLGPAEEPINHSDPAKPPDLKGRAIAAWYYFQQIGGFIVATFLAAGLSGLAR